jgi:hypothetical protein
MPKLQLPLLTMRLRSSFCGLRSRNLKPDIYLLTITYKDLNYQDLNANHEVSSNRLFPFNIILRSQIQFTVQRSKTTAGTLR